MRGAEPSPRMAANREWSPPRLRAVFGENGVGPAARTFSDSAFEFRANFGNLGASPSLVSRRTDPPPLRARPMRLPPGPGGQRLCEELGVEVAEADATLGARTRRHRRAKDVLPSRGPHSPILPGVLGRRQWSRLWGASNRARQWRPPLVRHSPARKRRRRDEPTAATARAGAPYKPGKFDDAGMRTADAVGDYGVGPADPRREFPLSQAGGFPRLDEHAHCRSIGWRGNPSPHDARLWVVRRLC